MSLYLDLLSKALLDTIHGPPPMNSAGKPWPKRAMSMVSPERMANVRQSCETALDEGIPGDFVECGVWRGGCSMMMAAVSNLFCGGNTTWLCDSFQGLPRPSVPQDESLNLWEFPELSVSEETVRENFRRFGIDTTHVRFLRGWFEQTLPTAPIEKIAVLRADADMYLSTRNIFDNLYDKVSPGGFVIVDDYADIDACKQAVDSFRAERNITTPMTQVDWTCVFWRKS